MVLERGQHISSIVADQDMVVITDVSGDKISISIREALLRARGILGLDKEAQDLVEQLLLAANEAKKYVQARDGEDPVGFTSAHLQGILNRARDEGKQV